MGIIVYTGYVITYGYICQRKNITNLVVNHCPLPESVFHIGPG